MLNIDSDNRKYTVTTKRSISYNRKGLTCYISSIIMREGWGEGALSKNLDLSYKTGSGCSKLTTSLVNVSLTFQMLTSQIGQYFLFFNKKFQCI